MMSPLQLGLIVIGVLLLLGVWGYQRWQTRRLVRRRVAAPASDAQGVQAQTERLEPTLNADQTLPTDRATTSTAATTRVLSDQIDVVVPLRLDKPVSGEVVLQSLPGSRRIGSKPMFVEGLPDNGDTDDAWELPRHGQRYRALRAGVQLANRAGPLNEIEYSEFVQKLQAWAEHLQTAADFPDMVAVVQRAREWDQFAAAHDVQLAFTIRARRAAWSPGYVMQHATRLGFVPGSLPGRMVLPATQPGDAPILVLQFDTQAALADDPELIVLRELRLTLDVTHVPRTEQPYQRLCELAQTLAAGMDGWITDDDAQVLDADTLQRIGTELNMLYDALEARGVPAGSPDARRLFS